MRSFILTKQLAALGVLAMVLLSARTARAEDCYILAVGVDEHLHGDKLKGPTNLRGVASGAISTTRAFLAQAGGRFGKVHAHTLINADATRANIRDRLNIISEQGKAYDFVVLFFAGHGGVANKQTWGFTPYDADPKNPAASAFTDRHILDAAHELVAQGKTVVVIIDSCQAGQVKKTAQDYLKRYEGPKGSPGGMIVMVSCGADELVFPHSGTTPFARAFADSMTDSGDLDGDQKVTLKELKAYTKKRTNELVLKGNKQTSDVLWSKSVSDLLPFAFLPAKTEVADPLPKAAVKAWTGKSIVAKNPGAKIDTLENGTRVPVATLDEASYRVLDEERGLIMVSTSPGVTGWLEKADAVLVEDAVAHFSDRIRANPSDAGAYNLRALVYKSEGRLGLAVKDYNEALRINPQVSVLLNRANTLYTLKDYDPAIDDFTAALKGDPNLTAALYGRGLALVAKKEYDSAIEDFSAVIELKSRKPVSVPGQKGWSEFVNKEGRYAVRLPREPKDSVLKQPTMKGVELRIPGSDFAVTFADLPIKNTPDAAAAQKILDDHLGTDPGKDPYQKKTSILLGRHHGQERLIDLPSGKKEKVRAYLVENRLYQLRYQWSPLRGGSVAEADTFLNSFRILHPIADAPASSAIPGYAAAAYNGRGDAHRGKKEFTKAIEDYSAALKLERKQPFVLNNRGLTFFLSGDYDNALKDFDASEKLDPENAWVYKNRAQLLATAASVKYRNGKKAVELAQKALDLERYPGAEFFETLAAAHAEAGNFADAVRVQAKAMEELDLKDDTDAVRRLALYRKKQPYRQTEFTEAEPAYHAAEKRLLEADSVEMDVSFVMKFEKNEDFLKGSVLLAKGGKARIEMTGDRDGDTFKMTIISDGAKTASRRFTEADKGEWIFRNAPSDAAAMITAGAGFYGFVFSQELDSVTGFAMGPKDKIDDREAQRIDYRIRFKTLLPNQIFNVQLWLDSETHLPIKRVITHETIDVRITEYYDIRLGGTIDAKSFVLPAELPKKEEPAKPKTVPVEPKKDLKPVRWQQDIEAFIDEVEKHVKAFDGKDQPLLASIFGTRSVTWKLKFLAVKALKEGSSLEFDLSPYGSEFSVNSKRPVAILFRSDADAVADWKKLKAGSVVTVQAFYSHASFSTIMPGKRNFGVVYFDDAKIVDAQAPTTPEKVEPKKEIKLDVQDLTGTKGPLWQAAGKGSRKVIGADVGIDLASPKDISALKPAKNRVLDAKGKQLSFDIAYEHKEPGKTQKVVIEIYNQKGQVDVEWEKTFGSWEVFKDGAATVGIRWNCVLIAGRFEPGAYQARILINGELSGIINWEMN